MQKYLLTSFLILSQFIVKAQSVSEKIVSAIDTFAFIQPQEKAYVQTDRNAYVTGEPIWFKVYTTLNEKPTILSKTVYVELISSDGKLLDKKMIKLKEGTASGVVDIKASYASGNYFLRAYTLWMLNFPDFITEKKLSIINTTTVTSKLPSKTKTPIDILVEFYPEGGNLISTLKSTVAFKAIDQNNDPVEIKADIINSKNEKVISIISSHNGMGKFEFLPIENETYKAVITFDNNRKKTVDLPKIYTEGVVLSIDNTNINKAFVSVTRSDKNKNLYNNLLVVAQINYQVAYVGKLNIDEGMDAVAINKKNLPPGIMQISLLTEAGKPLAERIVFVANHTPNTDSIFGVVVNTEKRKKNTLSIDLSKYKNLQAAVSITNASSTLSSNENILSSLLLSADIKGKIHNAASYFDNKEAVTLNNLDLVMLTNGWRRYKLEDIMVNKFSNINYPFETSMAIIGKVLQSDGKSLLKAGKVNLIINGEDSTKIISQANTNSNSAFLIDKLDFQKEATVFYQGTNLMSKEAIVSVKFSPNFYDTLSNPALRNNKAFLNIAALETNDYYNKIIAEKLRIENEKGKTLESVTVKTKKRSIVDSLNAQYATDIFYESDQTISVNTEINTGTVWQLLRTNVPGIVIFNSDTGTTVNFSRYEGANLFGNSTESGVQFFLNEVAVNIAVIESLFAEDIGLVKVFKGNSAIALGVTRGAIGLYTVKNKSFRDWRSKGFDFIKKLGYSTNREFPNLDYSLSKSKSEFADVRTTIYWNPNLIVKDGKVTVDFYNDDVCKKFKVVLEGIDENGKLLHTEREIE
jgi:hypothetical protein